MGLWAPVAAYMGLLYWLSAQTTIGPIPGNLDKLAHAIAYAGLGTLAMRAVHGGFNRAALLPTAVALLLTAGYAALDEWHQSHVPGRDANPMDWMADLAGAATCVPIFAILCRLRAALDLDRKVRLEDNT